MHSSNLKLYRTLFPEEYPEKNLNFMKEVGIKHFQIGMPGNKEPFVYSKLQLPIRYMEKRNSYSYATIVPKDRVAEALRVVLDRRNHPVLIHCNKGKVCWGFFSIS